MYPETIYERIRRIESAYQSASPTRISEHVSFSLRETISRVEAYLFSKHITGDKDSLGRDKPFFNIVVAARNIWYRATDIDRKNIRVKAANRAQFVTALLANIKLQEWMRRANFGKFLNDWGRTLATYGSALTKWVEKDGELIASIVPWNRVYMDDVDESNDLIVERLELTPAQLRANPMYDQEMVEKLITELQVRKGQDGMNKDTKSLVIPIYEAHGNIEKSYITDDENDAGEFVQQVHVVSFVEKNGKRGEYDEYTLYRGREKNPYFLTHLLKEEGRVISIGAVEHLFESQWMANHSQKAIKDQIDLASKMIQQTTDNTLHGTNFLLDVEVGDIIYRQPGTELLPVQWNTQNVAQWMQFQQMWSNLSKEITSTPDALRGMTMPSGTAYRQVAILNQESHSLFEIMTENKGLALEEMLRRFIIPFIKKQLDTTDEVVATLDAAGIQQIDSLYIPNEAVRRYNKYAKDTILSGGIPSPFQKDVMEQQIREELAPLGNQRFFKPSELDDKTWKDLFKDFEWEVEVEVTNETVDKEAVFTTLTTVLQSIAANPMILQDPNARMLFNRILEETGRISPIELSGAAAKPSLPQNNPIGGSNGGGEELLEMSKLGNV